jgi:hypothetical protein
MDAIKRMRTRIKLIAKVNKSEVVLLNSAQSII